jgi:hypothetical protein
MSERQIKQWIEDSISGMEARIIAKISARIDSEIRKLKQEQINNPSQGNELALATKKAAELATIDVMEKKYMPKIQAFVDDIKERTLDGGDLINEYRKRVVGGEAHKALMNTTAADFRRHAFVFKEDD